MEMRIIPVSDGKPRDNTSPRKKGKLRAADMQSYWRKQGYRVNFKYIHEQQQFLVTGRDSDEVTLILKAMADKAREQEAVE